MKTAILPLLVVALSAGGAAAHEPVQGLARTAGGSQGAWKSAQLRVPLSLQHVEAASLVIPQLGITQATLAAESRQSRSGFGRAAAAEVAIASC